MRPLLKNLKKRDLLEVLRVGCGRRSVLRVLGEVAKIIKLEELVSVYKV